MKVHTIAETITQAIDKTMFGTEAEKEINKFPFSDKWECARVAVGIEFQFPFPSHSHRNPVGIPVTDFIGFTFTTQSDDPS